MARPKVLHKSAGYRNCTLCGAWRPVLDFRPREWADESKTIIRRYHNQCRVCMSEREKKRHYSMNKRDKNRKRLTSRANYRRRQNLAGKTIGNGQRPFVKNTPKTDDAVDRAPFALWLIEKKDLLGSFAKVAKEIDMAERRVRAIVSGYYHKTVHTKRGKKTRAFPIDWITLREVDKSLTNWGELPHVLEELYPSTELDESVE